LRRGFPSSEEEKRHTEPNQSEIPKLHLQYKNYRNGVENYVIGSFSVTMMMIHLYGTKLIAEDKFGWFCVWRVRQNIGKAEKVFRGRLVMQKIGKSIFD